MAGDVGDNSVQIGRVSVRADLVAQVLGKTGTMYGRRVAKRDLRRALGESVTRESLGEKLERLSDSDLMKIDRAYQTAVQRSGMREASQTAQIRTLKGLQASSAKTKSIVNTLFSLPPEHPTLCSTGFKFEFEGKSCLAQYDERTKAFALIIDDKKGPLQQIIISKDGGFIVGRTTVDPSPYLPYVAEVCRQAQGSVQPTSPSMPMPEAIPARETPFSILDASQQQEFRAALNQLKASSGLGSEKNPLKFLFQGREFAVWTDSEDRLTLQCPGASEKYQGFTLSLLPNGKLEHKDVLTGDRRELSEEAEKSFLTTYSPQFHAAWSATASRRSGEISKLRNDEKKIQALKSDLDVKIRELEKYQAEGGASGLVANQWIFHLKKQQELLAQKGREVLQTVQSDLNQCSIDAFKAAVLSELKKQQNVIEDIVRPSKSKARHVFGLSRLKLGLLSKKEGISKTEEQAQELYQRSKLFAHSEKALARYKLLRSVVGDAQSPPHEAEGRVNNILQQWCLDPSKARPRDLEALFLSFGALEEENARMQAGLEAIPEKDEGLLRALEVLRGLDQLVEVQEMANDLAPVATDPIWDTVGDPAYIRDRFAGIRTFMSDAVDEIMKKSSSYRGSELRSRISGDIARVCKEKKKDMKEFLGTEGAGTWEYWCKAHAGVGAMRAEDLLDSFLDTMSGRERSDFIATIHNAQKLRPLPKKKGVSKEELARELYQRSMVVAHSEKALAKYKLLRSVVGDVQKPSHEAEGLADIALQQWRLDPSKVGPEDINELSLSASALEEENARMQAELDAIPEKDERRLRALEVLRGFDQLVEVQGMINDLASVATDPIWDATTNSAYTRDRFAGMRTFMSDAVTEIMKKSSSYRGSELRSRISEDITRACKEKKKDMREFLGTEGAGTWEYWCKAHAGIEAMGSEDLLVKFLGEMNDWERSKFIAATLLTK